MYQKITSYLDKCIEQNLLSHAYIFYGPDETAKKNIAMNFADKILKSTTEFKPDLLLISTEKDEEISINLIRQLKRFLTLSPYIGKYKVAIIERAENLNLYAQNALLKIFEEAPSHAIIIICVKTINLISETIASRGVKLPIWKENSADFKIHEKNVEIFDKMLDNSSRNQYRAIEQFNNLTATDVFKEWIKFLRIKFLQNQDDRLINLLRLSQNIYFKLNEINVNSRFAYDELILGLWKF